MNDMEGLKEYEVESDKFEPEDDALFSFPCNVCMHRACNDNEYPCNKCGHNLNADISTST